MRSQPHSPALPTSPHSRRPARVFRSLVLPVALCLAARAAAAGGGGDVVSLSPFVVHSDASDQYSANQTLSATRIATDTMNLPFSISVLTSQFASDIDARSIQDALQYLNIQQEPSQAFSIDTATSFIMRGFPATILRNSFPAASGMTPVAFVAVDRMEALKGPASLLYGALQPGGVVNVISKRPSFKPLANLSVSYGSYDNTRGTIDLSGPLDRNHKVAYRLLASGLSGHSNKDAFAKQRRELSGMLQFDFTPATTLNLEYDYSYNHVTAPPSGALLLNLVPSAQNGNRGTIQQYVLTYPWNMNYRGPGDYGLGEAHYFNAELHHHFSDNWNSRLAYAWEDSWTDRITRAGALVASPTRRGLTDTHADGKSITSTLQFDTVGRWTSHFVDTTLLLGAGYDHNTNRAATLNSTVVTFFNPADPSTWAQAAPPLSTFTILRANPTGNGTDYAAYSTGQFAFLNGRLRLVLGDRWQKAEAVSNATSSAGLSSNSFSITHNTVQTGVLGRVTRTLSLYASWSQSFVPQNQTLITPKPLDPATGLPKPGALNGSMVAQPLEGAGSDLGAKLQFFDGALTATASYFNIKETNIVAGHQVRDEQGNVLDDYQVQSGAERSQGVELTLAGALWQKTVTLTASYTHYWDCKLLAFDSAPAQAGRPLVDTPNHLFDVFIRYTPHHGWWKGGFAGIGAHATSAYQGVYPTSAQIATLPGYALFSAVVGYRWKAGNLHYAAQVNVSNLANRRVVLTTWSESMPRTIDGTFSVRF
ncbi:MAG TPA: TonB-dependent receptor plug domain-containing protein [Opitutaceae bacterium]|nr:TonB-dependent receptor plug domain-containing protein [Opitutaceae bacterium]